MTDIKEYESAIRSCFGDSSIQSLWYGGAEGKVGDDPNKMYIAITEDENWSQNRFVLRDWFFDYEKFKALPLELDCASYGVYVIWVKDDLLCMKCNTEHEGNWCPEAEEEQEWCEEHEQVMWKNGLKCSGCLEGEEEEGQESE